MTSPRTLQDWLAHCDRLHPRAIDLTLDRVQRVRQRLGLVFECPVFTVAGTNGKGSTCAMLESILLQSGYKVGVYTSPHLVHFEERCRVNGAMVQGERLLPHFEAVEAARQGDTLTYFEFTMLAILRLFTQAGLDAVVLEVGLGGRFDSTNVCRPLLSVAEMQSALAIAHARSAQRHGVATPSPARWSSPGGSTATGETAKRCGLPSDVRLPNSSTIRLGQQPAHRHDRQRTPLGASSALMRWIVT